VGVPMLTRRDQSEVFNPVVCAVAVDVVDMPMSPIRDGSMVSLPHLAVLGDCPPADVPNDIALGVGSPSSDHAQILSLLVSSASGFQPSVVANG
jgi:hypothetical protein